MKTARLPAIVFGFLLVSYVVFLLCTVSWLPERMATHFDANGQPNGWMNRSSAVIFQGIVGLLLPVIITTFFCTIRFVPVQRINVPNREYWFSPERRRETCTYLSRQGLWLASMLVGLQGLVWCQLLESNTPRTGHFSPTEFLLVLAVFGIAMIIWVLRLFRHFSKRAIV